MSKIKVIANYLPQFHRIPENDKWWGEGFTDWEAVKRAKPIYDWQYQPRVPQNNNYYDLSDENAIRWQADLAKKYGIHGFGIYHYWFSSEQHLLYKPAEILHHNKDIDINFFFIWGNSTWTRTWVKMRFSNDYAPAFDNQDNKSENGILVELKYGDESDWKKHFDYLLPFFKDERYIKIDGKPVFSVFAAHNNTKVLKKMMAYWDSLAKEAGLNGIFVLGKRNIERKKISEYELLYEPGYSVTLGEKNICKKVLLKFKTTINRKRKVPDLYDYTKSWKKVIKNAESMKRKTIFYSGFVDFDDTARREKKARIMKRTSPEIFEKYFTKLLQISQKHGKEYVFLTAWNEWGEGAYLEPDTRYGTAYLEAVKRAVETVNKE